jgi:hypothetical protein
VTRHRDFYLQKNRVLFPPYDKCFYYGGDYEEKQWGRSTIKREPPLLELKNKEPKNIIVVNLFSKWYS